jgi:dipeptidyl aminopeptidase/acylaminoacyl peptidase
MGKTNKITAWRLVMIKRGKRTPILFLWLLLVCSGHGFSGVYKQPKRPFVPEDVLRQKRLSDPQISPSGEWVAFVVSQFEENKKANSDVWVVSRDKKTLRRVVENPGPDSSPRWSPDGTLLAFLSRQGRDTNTQIYMMFLENGKIKRITDEKGNIRDMKWSPDGTRIAVLKNDPPSAEEIIEREAGRDAVVVGENYKHARLWILDVQTRKIRLLTFQDQTIWLFNWSPDSRKLAVLASPMPTAEGNEYQSHLSVIDAASGGEKVLVKKTNPQAAPSFSPDGKQIAFIGPVGRFKERGIIKVVSADGGEPKALLEDFKGNVWDCLWHPRQNIILAGLARGVRHNLVAVDLKGDVRFLFEMNFSIIPYWGTHWTVSADGKQAAFLNERLDCPKEIWLGNLNEKTTEQLTHFNDYLGDVELGKVEEVKWKNPADGAEVNGIVVKPAGSALVQSRPLVVWLHGGPAYNWSLGIQTGNWAQLFAARGYVVFLPNFRGSSGQGMVWMTANVENWGRGPKSDVMSGIDFLIKKGWIDEKRMFVGGSSYGGYLTAWIITQTDRFHRAYVSAGVTDLATEYALTDEPSFLIGYFNQAPYDNPDVYRDNSPLTFAARVKTPVLIVHGERDLRVPVSQAYEFYSALKHYGAEVKLVIYPRESHGVREYDHQIDLMTRVLDWFQF